MTRDEILSNFNTGRYHLLNAQRWQQFPTMGISLEGKTIFETGAGIGDQTEWLLQQGVRNIRINEGRPENMQIIRERFDNDGRVSFWPGDIETCLDEPEFQFTVDVVFCYGVYYHVRESFPGWHIMKALARIGKMIVLEYLVGSDEDYFYGYENPSTSISQHAFRPKQETLMNALKDIWGHAYLPAQQLEWVDPVAPETRLIAVASHKAIRSNGLESWT